MQSHDLFIALEAFISLNARTEAWETTRSRRYPTDPFDYTQLIDYQIPSEYASSSLDVESTSTVQSLPLAESVFFDEEEVARSSTRRRYGYEAVTVHKGDQPAGDALTLVAGLPEIVVLGSAGSGKSTVARELQYRLAHATTGEFTPGRVGALPLPPLMPIVVHGSAVHSVLRQARVHSDKEPPPGDTLRAVAEIDGITDAMLGIGAVHVTVDALNELGNEARERVAAWLLRLRERYPFTPLMVCHRRFDFRIDILPFPCVVLQNVTAEQARAYIHDVLRLRGQPDATDRAAALASLLLDNPENAGVRDLARTPLFLWMIVERYADAGVLPENIGALFADFSQWFIEERHHGEKYGESPIPNRYSYKQKMQLLEVFGAYLVEHGNLTSLADGDTTELLATLAETGLTDPEAILREIATSEMLFHTDDGWHFYHQSFQEYFASRVFSRQADNEDLLRERALRFDWREPLRMMLGFSGDRPELARRTIDILIRANPMDAAYLLRACETPPPEAIEGFLKAETTVLLDARAGQMSWQAASGALADYRTDAALRALHQIVKQPDAPLAAREAALTNLLRVLSEERDANQSDSLKQELTHTIRTLITTGAPADLQEATVRGAGDRQLHGLVLPIADLIDEAQPWDLMSAAADTLNKLGEALTGSRLHTYINACEARLNNVESDVRGDISRQEREKLQEERLELLEVLAEAGRMDVVLARRFSIDLADDHAWGRLLSRDAISAASSLPAHARAVLRGELDPESTLNLFKSSDDPLITAAAAHALLELSDADVAKRIVLAVTAESTPVHVLAAAEAASLLEEDPGRHIEALIEPSSTVSATRTVMKRSRRFLIPIQASDFAK